MLNVKDEELAFNINLNVLSYKGIYYQEEPEQRYYEGGAHFSHYLLCQKLEEIILTISPERRGNSIYDTPNLSNIISDSNTNTKAETRKIASDNSKELLKKEKSLANTQKQRNKANNNLPNNNSIVKNSKSGAVIKSVKETFKKIQPKNLLYNHKLKTSEKQSAIKLHINKESSATKLYSKPNKCIIDLNLNVKKNLNQTLKTQKSSSICSTTKANNEIVYKIVKNPTTTNKIINLDLNKKLYKNTNNNTNSNINTTNNNELETSKNKDRDKKKIISAFNTILNITNNKSRNLQQPKKNSMENKTAENAPNKIFVTNQLKLDTNKTKDNKFEENIINTKLASRNIIPRKFTEEKTKSSKKANGILKGILPTYQVYSVQNTEARKNINTSKTKIIKPTKLVDNFDSNNTTKKNIFNLSKKVDNTLKQNGGNRIIKITTSQKEKSEVSRLQSNFLNFSKNLPITKKI